MSLHAVARSIQKAFSMSDDVLIHLLTEFIVTHTDLTQEQIGEWLMSRIGEAQEEGNEGAAGT